MLWGASGEQSSARFCSLLRPGLRPRAGKIATNMPLTGRLAAKDPWSTCPLPPCGSGSVVCQDLHQGDGANAGPPGAVCERPQPGTTATQPGPAPASAFRCGPLASCRSSAGDPSPARRPFAPEPAPKGRGRQFASGNAALMRLRKSRMRVEDAVICYFPCMTRSASTRLEVAQRSR